MTNYIKPNPKDPAYQLIIGNPAEIIGATQSPRILLINTHGTEHLAARVMHYLQTKRSYLLQYVDYICGNPRAAAAIPQQRYTKGGTDLNRSFIPKGKPKTYEEKRAAELTPKLQIYDYIIDLHTTTTTAGNSKRFAIIVNAQNRNARKIIAASPLERIVVLPSGEGYLHDVVRPIVAFEYNQNFALTQVAIKEVVHILDVLIGNTKPTPKSREFFYVDRLIPRNEDPGIDTPNFKLCKDGYYPVLLGDNSYRRDPSKPYVGFAATRKEIVTL